MPAKKVSREDKMYNVKLIYVGWEKKPDLLIEDQEFSWGEVLKEGDRLAKEYGYTTFTFQEAKKKRAPRKPATKSKPKTTTKTTKDKPKTTTKTTKSKPKTTKDKPKTTRRRKANAKTEK